MSCWFGGCAVIRMVFEFFLWFAWTFLVWVVFRVAVFCGSLVCSCFCLLFVLLGFSGGVRLCCVVFFLVWSVSFGCLFCGYWWLCILLVFLFGVGFDKLCGFFMLIFLFWIGFYRSCYFGFVLLLFVEGFLFVGLGFVSRSLWVVVVVVLWWLDVCEWFCGRCVGCLGFCGCLVLGGFALLLLVFWLVLWWLVCGSLFVWFGFLVVVGVVFFGFGVFWCGSYVLFLGWFLVGGGGQPYV